MDILPEIQLVKDAYRHSSNQTGSSILAMRKLLALKTNGGNKLLIAQSSLFLSSLYIRVAEFQEAEKILVNLQPLLQKLQDKKLQWLENNQHASIKFSNKKYGAAIVYYNLVLELSKQLNIPLIFAITQQALGEVQLNHADTTAALTNFNSAYIKLRDNNEVLLAADVGILYFALNTKLDEDAPSEINLLELISFIRMTPDEKKRLQQFVEVSNIYGNLTVKNLSSEVNDEFQNVAVEAFLLSIKLMDGPLIISTSGRLALLYEKEGRYAVALEILQEGLRGDQVDKNSAVMIPLYVQQGRLLKLSDHVDESAKAYRLALGLLKKLILDKGNDVETSVTAMLFGVYDALVDLYFTQSFTPRDNLEVDASLSELRILIEEKNYFYYKKLLNDDYADYEKNKESIAILSKKTAVIYPVVYPDRLEILLSLPNGLQRYTSDIDKAQLLEKINAVRLAIEHPSKNFDFQEDAMSLYFWLVEPFKMKLLRQNISSLVFVLDKTLASIPPSVLFDKKGRRYLIEQYSIVTSPGLMLSNNDVRGRKRSSLLYFGLTSQKNGFASSLLLKKEVDSITTVTTSLLKFDSALQLDSMQKVMQSNNSTRVHMSMPLSVKSNYLKSFVTLAEGNIPLATLAERVRLSYQKKHAQRLDLVVLSNGSTPRQDSDAGLMTISYNLGSRSTIVSLWPQAFEATPLFMDELYRNLNSPRISVASAVRRAKMRLIASKDYQHPAYWAKFQLFGRGR
ncbi:MAG: CHAT domain-containing protein [Thiohalomonadales bacterium]